MSAFRALTIVEAKGMKSNLRKIPFFSKITWPGPFYNLLT